MKYLHSFIVVVCEYLRAREGRSQAQNLMTHTFILGSSHIWAPLLTQPACTAQWFPRAFIPSDSSTLWKRSHLFSATAKGRKCKSSFSLSSNKVKLGPGRASNEAWKWSRRICICTDVRGEICAHKCQAPCYVSPFAIFTNQALVSFPVWGNGAGILFPAVIHLSPNIQVWVHTSHSMHSVCR